MSAFLHRESGACEGVRFLQLEEWTSQVHSGPGEVDPWKPPEAVGAARPAGSAWVPACGRTRAGRPGAPAGSGRGSYPSTDRITREGLLRGSWTARYVSFPDGGLERTVYWLPLETPLAPRGRRKGKRVRQDLDRRASKMVRSLVRQNQLRVMWTFTYPAPGCHDRAKAFGDIAAWMKDYGQEVRREHGYVTVLELHPKGHGWHVHLFTGGGRYSQAVLDNVRESWTAFLVRRGWQPSGGASAIRVHVKLWPNLKKAAWYASKYASKGVAEGDRGVGRRRYTRSLGLMVRAVRVQGRFRALSAPVEGLQCVRSWDSRSHSDWLGYPCLWDAWEPSG